MVEKKDRRAVLLAVHPKYASLILSGVKTVEFRRQRFSSNVDYIVLYATSPIKAIVGYAFVQEILADEVIKLWKRFNGNSGVTQEDFFEYYKDYTIGYAIYLSHPVKLKKPLSLMAISSEMKSPQSFMYLNNIHFQKIAGARHE